MLTQPLTDFALVQSAGLNIEELYKEEKKKNRGFGNYRTSYGDRGVGGSNQNQSGNSNTIVGAVNERARREFTDLGRPLSTVLRSCIKNGVLSKLPVDPTKPMRGKYMDRNCDYHQCKGGLPEEVVLAEAEWEEQMCAMLNIWDDCSSDEEEKVPVKAEIKKSITVKVGDVPEDEDEQLQLAIQKSLADQEEWWYYSSEEEVNEVSVQSLTRSGRVYNPESSMQAKGKEVVVVLMEQRRK
ncbi:hypothetical protein JCGZ_03805 [Jatropha curcas]|uniref:Uncharacterized protein n=1 Tax=Jatropha curcas TaxID=180498 RepID=A0A067JNJ1_JATCU|nr:hypothetical protein JCGZ_03805 [Jatropha curcas]